MSMSMSTRSKFQALGFTLVELMIVVGVLGILVTLAAPSMYDFILTQRLKGISAQITTDMQFARSEATSRNVKTHVRFSSATGQTCYMIYASTSEDGTKNICGCEKTPRCGGDGTELRTVNIPSNLKVQVLESTNPLSMYSYDPSTGGLVIPVGDADLPVPPAYYVDATINQSRTLRTVVSLAGRPITCAPPGSSMSAPPCPARGN
jgi:type IV fimbrial biogenesis protein FimT